MTPPANLIGRRFGRLTVLFQSTEWRPSARTMWACQCDCGGTKIARTDSLRDGQTKSCGCLKRDQHFRFSKSYIAKVSAEWSSLLDVLEETLTRFPQTPAEIRSDFERVWGSCHPRRFWRALRTLVEQGRAVRRGDTNHMVYTRAIPWSRNLANCIAEAAATFAVFELGMRRAA